MRLVARYNPEAAARDLVSKCLLCLDEAVEWPPTAPPAAPLPPPPRFALLKPALGSLNAELTGLRGTVVGQALYYLAHHSEFTTHHHDHQHLYNPSL